MKRITLLTFVVLSLILSNACNKGPDTGPDANSSPVTALTPKISPTPDTQPRSGDLVDATSSGDISYALAGIDSTRMTLKVRNKTERVWTLRIEVGTKLEPESGDVQRMVVTKELEVELDSHEVETVEVEVSCLDITKPPPSESDNRWGIRKSEILSRFIKCANDAIETTESDHERANILQFSIWQARGATHDESVHFWTDNGLSPEQAEQRISEYETQVLRVTSRCESLRSI